MEKQSKEAKQKMFTELSKSVEAHKKEKLKFKKIGIHLANDLLNHSKDSLSIRYSMGEFFRVLYESQPEDECGEQLFRWSWEQFWETQVEKHIHVFLKIYNQLKNLGATRENPLVYGDIDYSAWVEDYEEKQIIGVTCHCSCADDNTHIFIYKKSLDRKYFKDTFHARTVWPRETIYKYGRENWPNDSCWRDIGKPSYLTYRRHGFKPGYKDSRDKGYSFSYGVFGSGVPVPNSTYRIAYALRELSSIQYGIDDPLELPI